MLLAAIGLYAFAALLLRLSRRQVTTYVTAPLTYLPSRGNGASRPVCQARTLRDRRRLCRSAVLSSL